MWEYNNIMRIKIIILTLLIFLTLNVRSIFSDETSVNRTNGKIQDAAPGKESVTKVEENVAATQQIIKEKKEAVKEVRQQAEQAIAEKKEAEQEVQLNKEAVAATKQEAAVLKKEAATKSDTELLKKSRILETKAEKLEKEAQLYSEKVSVAESKAQIALEQIAAKEIRLESLQKSLKSLQKEKIDKTSLAKKAAGVLTILFLALIVLLVLRFGLKIFMRHLTKKSIVIGREVAIRIKTFARMFGWLGIILTITTASFFILETFGVSVAPLIAGASIVGIAFGFGGQYLIRDVISGFFILIEDQYRIDDVVKIGEYSGLVADINLRITTLRDLESHVIIIPNGEIKAVINYTKEYAHALLDMGIAYKENVDQVMDVIKEIGKEMREDKYYGVFILDDLEMFGVDNFLDSAVIIKFRIKTLPMKQWDVSREFKRRIKNRFDKLGIEIPFPHRTIYWGKNKDGSQSGENA
jgi:small conductance mechanosensitive channel